jgi:hypothetical protein
MKTNKIKIIMLTLVIFAFALSSAHALLMGNTVNYQYYYPGWILPIATPLMVIIWLMTVSR